MLIKNSVNPKFSNLFTPGYIGKLLVKNRLIRSPFNTSLATMDGCITDRQTKHYRELARGETGLVIVEMTYVDDKASRIAVCGVGGSNISHQPGLGLVAETIKENGARAGLQIGHGGAQSFLWKPPLKAKPDLKSASRIPWEQSYDMGIPAPEELTMEEIEEIIEAFGDTALRAKIVEFDLVEIHGGHGYLVTNFLSPYYNKRTDFYGGSLKNRMRFPLEVVRNIRKKTGDHFPLSIRLSATDYEEGGINIDETKELSRELEKAGVDIIHVSGGTHHMEDWEVPSMYRPLATHLWAVEQLKKVVSIPVVASGGITSPELAEKILEEGKADFIGLGRALIADPYFSLKARQGRPEDIAPCIRCGEGCIDRGSNTRSVHCDVNATVGREEELRITPVAKSKKVAVVGGGPAGMEAARVAALRGHEVTLFEKRKLGGMLIEASIPDFKSDIKPLIDYLSTQVKKTRVKIIKGEATSDSIKDGKFDAVIVATGTTPWLPDIPGVDKSFVIEALEALSGAQIGKNVIVVGGGLIGCDVALSLAEQKKRVIITTRRDEIGEGLTEIMKPGFLERLSKQDVEIRTKVHLEEVTDSGIMVHNRSGYKSEIKGDSVVLATGLKPNIRLFEELSEVSKLEVYAVGDCVEPRTIYDAIHEGYSAAYNLLT